MDILPSPQQLRYLIALSELQHFGRAANACSVTQSTLSAGILNLERQLNISILDRSAGKRVVFTPIGEEIAIQARVALQGLESVREVVNFAREPFGSPLKLGIIPTIGPYLLPLILLKMQQYFPKVSLSIHEDLTENLMEQLSIGYLDLLVIAMPCICSGSETLALFKDDFYIVMPTGHYLEEFEQVPLEKVNAKEVIHLQDGHCLRDQTLDMCRQTQNAKLVHDGQNNFVASSLKTVVEMIRFGLGIGFLPKMVIDTEIPNKTGLVIRPVIRDTAWRTIGLAWRRHSLRAREFQQFEKIFNNLK